MTTPDNSDDIPVLTDEVLTDEVLTDEVLAERAVWRLSRNGMIGGVTVAAALGLQEFVAGLSGVLPSLMGGSATWVIDVAPAGLVEWAISNLENWTKRVLVIGIAAVLVLAGILTSALGRTARWSVIGVVALLGSLATAAGDPTLLASLTSGAIAASVAFGTDTFLRRSAARVTTDPALSSAGGSRRAFLLTVGAVAGLAVLAAAGGRTLFERARRGLARRDDVVLPDVIETVDPVTAVHEFDVEGLEPVVTPNERFFKVDIAPLNPPVIDLTDWTLTLTGMVDREVVLTYDDLLAMDQVEKYVTLSCVSNKVGGRLVGNAVWQGIPLRHILELAGVDPRTEQVAARGADGFSVGFPLASVYDRDTLLAIGMNGEPLPYAHGFPARLVVPGHYGFVSAAKWVEKIEMTTWDGHDAYWVRIGWAKYAEVETQSRIDAPRDRTTFAAGPRQVAGVAWAPHRGISRVEVRIDDGPWTDAEVSEPLSSAAWVQWQIPWDAPVGEHTISVRATDGTGTTQTAQERPPVPNGATGRHTVRVSAE
jgi:DMSO/TMAO reductase YedYZ molybdopterin-dependent catalytic subunit